MDGNIFIWNNRRGGEHNIRERLDRCVANETWLELWPKATVEHIVWEGSDHLPVILHLCGTGPISQQGAKGRKFDAYWCHDEDFEEVVKAEWKGTLGGGNLGQ